VQLIEGGTTVEKYSCRSCSARRILGLNDAGSAFEGFSSLLVIKSLYGLSDQLAQYP